MLSLLFVNIQILPWIEGCRIHVLWVKPSITLLPFLKKKEEEGGGKERQQSVFRKDKDPVVTTIPNDLVGYRQTQLL